MGILRSVLDYVESFQPGADKIRRDTLAIREKLKQEIGQLIPLSGGELELLSQTRTGVEVKKRFSYRVKGVFNSIYHEPMVAFSMKRYRSGSRNYLLYARTKQREYVYRLKKDRAFVYMNGSALGTIKEDDKLYGGKNNRLIARLERSEDKYWPMVVLGKELTHFVNPRLAENVNPRAFYFMRQMDRHEESVILALALYTLLIYSREFREK